MAVLIEAFSVIVRNATLNAKYPGGLEAYWRDRPNNTFCADDHLSRVSFMMPGDADVFVARLAAKGLMPYRKEAAEDVALVNASGELLRLCAWLELGRWGPVSIAWQAGTKRGDLHAPPGWNVDRRLRQISWEEMKQRLEFVRTEGGVDVYRDKTTGEETYVGRTAAPSEAIIARHNELYKEAWGLIEGLLLFGDKGPGLLDAPSRQRLEQAIPLFEEVVHIRPSNWAAMWLLGKVYQRLGDYERGLDWFARSHRVNPDHPDVAREASIAAMDAGRPEEAVGYCERALEASPDDAGLRANLALALLFSGKPAEAKVAGADALGRNPADAITAQVVMIIDEVLASKRACPHHVRDLG
jgi:tetratricopeptide (TPR) repeat protein